MSDKDSIPDYCVGIQYGDYDDKIRASSELDSNSTIKGCKLDKIMPKESGHKSAWIADQKSDKNPWIEVNFGEILLTTGVSIQKRGDRDEYASKVRVLYSKDGEKFYNIGKYSYYNSDNGKPDKKKFPIPVYAQYIRIQILEFFGNPALRFEVHYIPNDIPEIVKNNLLSKYFN